MTSCIVLKIRTLNFCLISNFGLDHNARLEMHKYKMYRVTLYFIYEISIKFTDVNIIRFICNCCHFSNVSYPIFLRKFLIKFKSGKYKYNELFQVCIWKELLWRFKHSLTNTFISNFVFWFNITRHSISPLLTLRN